MLAQDFFCEKHLAMYQNRKLAACYPTVERKALAIKWVITEHVQMTLLSHNGPNPWMAHTKDNNVNVTCWFLPLQDFSGAAPAKKGNTSMLMSCPVCIFWGLGPCLTRIDFMGVGVPQHHFHNPKVLLIQLKDR